MNSPRSDCGDAVDFDAMLLYLILQYEKHIIIKNYALEVIVTRTAPTPLSPEEREKRFIDRLNKITRKSKQQLEFINLHSLKISKQPYDETYYNALKKFITAEFRANDAKINAAKIVSKKDEAQAKTWIAQKERTHLLCALGGLIVKAGLDQIDREVLAGMISNMAGSYKTTASELETPDKADDAQKRIDGWTAKGKAFLSKGAA